MELLKEHFLPLHLPFVFCQWEVDVGKGKGGESKHDMLSSMANQSECEMAPIWFSGCDFFSFRNKITQGKVYPPPL